MSWLPAHAPGLSDSGDDFERVFALRPIALALGGVPDSLRVNVQPTPDWPLTEADWPPTEGS